MKQILNPQIIAPIVIFSEEQFRWIQKKLNNNMPLQPIRNEDQAILKAKMLKRTLRRKKTHSENLLNEIF